MHQNFRLIFIVFTIVCCVSLTSSCGRKALPLPPKISEPPVVEKIKADLNVDKLQLTWPLPETVEADDLAGFYVYRSKEKSGDSPCSQCPGRFDKVADIAYDTVSILFEKRVVYMERLEKGYQYKYRVTSYSAYGDEGLPSDEVTITY
jgi:hypothetical protein